MLIAHMMTMLDHDHDDDDTSETKSDVGLPIGFSKKKLISYKSAAAFHDPKIALMD